jgi:hypothetical protein
VNVSGEGIMEPPLKTDRPPGWDKPELTAHFERLWSNTVATFAQKRESHRLCRIDEVMYEISIDWRGASPTAQSVVPLFMFFRAHSSFRGACALGMGGATVEGFAVLRQAVEFAGYAALMHDEPALANLWWDRDQTPDDLKKVRRAFTHGAIKTAIEKADASLSAAYESLYDRLIQFGAHPNEKSISGNLRLERSASQVQLQQVYLQGDGDQLDHWIHTANQVGILVLKIFEKIHVKRFSDLGAGPRIDRLANGL